MENQSKCMNCCLRRFCQSAIWDFTVNNIFDNNFDNILKGFYE
jgi:hypothetical protein